MAFSTKRSQSINQALKQRSPCVSPLIERQQLLEMNFEGHDVGLEGRERLRRGREENAVRCEESRDEFLGLGAFTVEYGRYLQLDPC